MSRNGIFLSVGPHHNLSVKNSFHNFSFLVRVQFRHCFPRGLSLNLRKHRPRGSDRALGIGNHLANGGNLLEFLILVFFAGFLFWHSIFLQLTGKEKTPISQLHFVSVFVLLVSRSIAFKIWTELKLLRRLTPELYNGFQKRASPPFAKGGLDIFSVIMYDIMIFP